MKHKSATLIAACTFLITGLFAAEAPFKLAKPTEYGKTNEWTFAQSTDLSVQKVDYVYYPPGYHALLSRAVNGESLKTEDDTLWAVSPSHWNEVVTWYTYDPIILYPCGWLWSWDSYKYLLYNGRKKTSVQVKLLDGPLTGGWYTREIVSVDYNAGTIRFTDDTFWQVEYPAELAALGREWNPGQAVIFGLNSTWFCTSFDRILLNVERGLHVPARQY